MKKTDKDFLNLLEQQRDSRIPASTKNKTWFKLMALWLYLLMIEANTNKLGKDVYRPKKKLSKRSICIYMAQHNKSFRAFYLAYKKKKYPKNMNRRKEIGLNFYHNIICDKRKNWESPFIYKLLRTAVKKVFVFEGKDRKRVWFKIPRRP